MKMLQVLLDNSDKSFRSVPLTHYTKRTMTD